MAGFGGGGGKWEGEGAFGLTAATASEGGKGVCPVREQGLGFNENVVSMGQQRIWCSYRVQDREALKASFLSACHTAKFSPKVLRCMLGVVVLGRVGGQTDTVREYTEETTDQNTREYLACWMFRTPTLTACDL